jgi:hypothetical protein
MKDKITNDQRETAIAKLRENLPFGCTVYTVLVNAGSKAQKRHYTFLRVRDTEKGAEIENYTWLVARVIRMPRHPVDGGIMTTDNAHGLVALLGLDLYSDHNAFNPCRLD